MCDAQKVEDPGQAAWPPFSGQGNLVFRGRREPHLLPELSPQATQSEGFDYCDNGTMTDDDTNTRTYEADSKHAPNNDFGVAVGTYP
jgi:hypothetical protein